MKILISADMEGVTGVTTREQITPGHAEYARFRSLMTADVNAAIRGAFDGGADEVEVADGHWAGSNLRIEELDPRARLNSGSPSPDSMMQGIRTGIDGVFFVGYHARHGSTPAVLDHTWDSGQVHQVLLGGKPAGEYTLNAALAGHFGVPVVLATGDQTACSQIAELVPGVEVAVVKIASARFAAQCLPPNVSQELIEVAAAKAARRLSSGQAPPPIALSKPVHLEVEFQSSDMADRAVRFPGTTREGLLIAVVSADMLEAYSAFRAMVALSRSD
jgi:D-amino peptidase